MANPTADERLKRLRTLATSSVVGADLAWLLEEHDRYLLALQEIAIRGRNPIAEKALGI